ncbi:hypothetical protein [Streptomyces sp. CBG31]|uniref:hypothetical protein n=1 Tax=Streptomyces sp. CBG31 TaxID=2762623 RepID=UPI0037D9A8DA
MHGRALLTGHFVLRERPVLRARPVLRGHLLLLGPGGGGRRRAGPLDQGPERTVADGALEQAHPGRTDDIGPAGGRRPEEVVGLRGVTVLVALPLPVPAVGVPPEGRTLPRSWWSG